MYLDYKHPRAARSSQREVRWIDVNGNTHKLDIVIEQNGSETELGAPKAFIEVAWRRYTKHSKNKAQEISAAIRPLVARYRKFHPFYGAVLAGEFTENSLNQMRSEGFELLYFSIEAIEKAFASFGIDAHWNEDTPDEVLQRKVAQLEPLTDSQRAAIGDELMADNSGQWEAFSGRLQAALSRAVESVCVTPLFGIPQDFPDVRKACAYVASDLGEIVPDAGCFNCYEITVSYSDGDHFQSYFKERRDVLLFLETIV